MLIIRTRLGGVKWKMIFWLNYVERALYFPEFTDFEDAVQYYTALNGDCAIIVTRNPKDFRKSEIPVFTPSEFLSIPFWTNDMGDKFLNEPSN